MDETHVKAAEGATPPGAELERAVLTLLAEIGEDASRDGLVGTPERVRRMYGELTEGYRTDPDALINGARYEVDYDEMVVVRDIEFYSLCEHHLLPFYGRAHVGYLPRGRVIGLSKIPRIVDMYAHRLQVQERMTQEVARYLMDRLEPKGVACVVEATHLCTMMRGVKKQQATMVTSAMLGTFRRDPRTRGEFLTLIGRTVAS
ncbi:MAG TPA: GTP cyclohydrolase I FolE [Candidatus Limnocylindrales bacterium]|nr:GTP cyclohydrolase I FolE [Candidatus Limnocylindrales bacterium]